MLTPDQSFREIHAAATPEERAEHARASADRLIAAIAEAQGATVLHLSAARVRVDVYGNTYVQADSTVLARIMNADLRRLGF